VLRLFNRHVFADEVRYRTATRTYMDLWLAAKAAGEDEPMLREGRRVRWIETALAPLRSTVAPATWDRLVAALTLVAGAEIMVVMRDVAHLDADAALEVTDWAARALITAALAEDPPPP
jgi:hypothetical protein